MASVHFKALEKVKPSASRNASSETYYLCRGYEQSQNPDVIRYKRMADIVENSTDPLERDQVLDELVDEQ